MGDQVDVEFLLSIGFVKTTGFDQDTYFYERADVWVHFTNEHKEIDDKDFKLTNVITKDALVQHLIDHCEYGKDEHSLNW